MTTFEGGETLPTNNPIEQLDLFVTSERQRLEDAFTTIVEGLPIVEDLDECNRRLAEAGRPDLAVTLPAGQMEVTDPSEVLERCNNFTPNFQVTTGFTVRLEDRSEYKLPPKEHHDRISVTNEELDSVAAGSPTFEDVGLSHTGKPAFQRMLIIFPDFTRRLTLAFSEQGYGELYERYIAELFAAYQLMSRLVDQNDEYVMKDGVVDDWYLCR